MRYTDMADELFGSGQEAGGDGGVFHAAPLVDDGACDRVELAFCDVRPAGELLVPDAFRTGDRIAGGGGLCSRAGGECVARPQPTEMRRK